MVNTIVDYSLALEEEEKKIMEPPCHARYLGPDSCDDDMYDGHPLIVVIVASD